MLNYLAKRAESEGWTGLETRVIDGRQLNLSQEADFAHVFVSFAIFVLLSHVTGLLANKVLPSGTLSVSTWACLP
jgi:hypothetical protein